MSPSWSVTRIGIGDRVDDEIEPVALVADFRLREPQRAVALLDLFLRARQVGHVAQHGDDVGALPLVLRAGAQQLEQQVGALERIDQQELAARGFDLGDRARRERGREQHVVQRDRAPPAFAGILGRGEQLLRVRVRDDQLALRIGEQDRVGDRVDDAVQQHPLLPEACLGEGLAALQPRHLPAEHPGDPASRRDGRSVPTRSPTAGRGPSPRPPRGAGPRGTRHPRWAPGTSPPRRRNRLGRRSPSHGPADALRRRGSARNRRWPTTRRRARPRGGLARRPARTRRPPPAARRRERPASRWHGVRKPGGRCWSAETRAARASLPCRPAKTVRPWRRRTGTRVTLRCASAQRTGRPSRRLSRLSWRRSP